MEQTERVAASPSPPPPPPPAPLPADEDVRRSPGQPEAQLAAEGPQSGSREAIGSGQAAGWELQQPGGSALQLEFQDSSSSPGFSLVPQRSGVDEDVTEESLFQKSDTEFAPLRAYPDLSVASDRFPSPPEDSTTQVSDYASLSQHPLAQATLLSEEMTSSCSLSQVSVSLQEGSSRESSVHSPHAADDELEVSSSQEKDAETPTDASVQTEAPIDEADFLRSDVAAQDLLERLQKDVGVPSTSSSSTVASSSALCESESMRTSADVSTASREGPPGEASHPPHAPGPPHVLSPEVANITVGSRSTEPDDGMAALHRELLSESAMGSSHEARESVSPPTETLQGKASVTRTQPGGAPQAGPAAAEPDLLSSSSQTGIDGSYLGFLPQSQSTPGVFKAPSKSSVHRAFEPLSTIESSFGSGGGAAAPGGDDPRRRTADLVQRGGATTRVQSLPSLNYLQKVDAWRENQSLGRTSLFDSLALQGFHGVSPKQRAYDAVSDTLNRILTQQALGLGPAAAVGASPGRGEAAGAHTSASPGGRSQSHSSLSTVVMSTRKDQKTRSAAAAARPSPLANLGAFSDVSIEMDLMLSSSQDSSSSNSATKVGTSVGASSISLEVDNYAPYWTSKIATPPPARPRELNIEERIPVYLQNLGIDQSVSTILTPFAPRGPIREPEFSPTDLCTIKGSIGTPTKSAQPSEGGTPYKGEFSRSSVLSVASSISVPPSLESLGLGFRERARAPSAEFLQRAGSSTSSRSAADPGDLFLFAKDSCRSRWGEQSPEEPSDNAAALLEIHRILSRAGNDPSAASRLRSDDDLFVSPRERGARPRDSSSTTTSVATGSRTGPSLLWAGSSSDTLLTSEKLQDTSAGSEVAVETGVTLQKNRGAAGLLVSTESARRAEPEGCSAAPPDGAAPTITPQQPADEDQQSGSAPSSSSSPAETQDADQAALSDGSSGSSLAARVAALLQSEYANTVMSSTDSSTEQDQNPAREWIKLKLSGQQCEPLQLDQEDRERIEEIKRELLLKHPVQSHGSTDTESSTESPNPAHTEPRPPVQPPPNLLLADLETQVRQIAAREGVLLSRSGARPLTSITIASCKRDSASSSPSPPVSPAPHRPAEEAESPASVLEAPLSAADHRRLYVPENLPPLRHQDESFSQDGGGSAQAAAAERSARPGHVSCVRLTLSPKTAAATRAHTEFVQLRHSTPAGSSPDEGVGLCSPPEWSEGREAARTHTAALLRTAAALQRDDATATAAAAHRTQTAALPLLLPYKPPGSDELFYVPQTEAADQSDTTMESSHTGSDDAVPPQFSSEVLGQRDPGLDRGVTIRHSEGIYSKRSPEVSGRMQGAARRAADKSSQTSTSAPLKLAEPSPRRDLPAYERRQRPSSAPQTAEAPRSGESLDELWRRFYQQWRLEGAEPSGQREALLLECLSRLVSERHAATQRRDTEGGASREHDGKRSTLRRDWTPPSAAPASRSRHFCPADRDESTTSGSASTVDTARLVRAFGAQRVQQRPRGGASLGKLYGAISRQREEGETLAPTDESTVTLDSSSCTSTHTPPHSQLRPSRLLAAKKAVRVVSRGVQAGELEIVSDATRRRTRDVGTIFPSPAATLASSSSTPPAWGAERDRRGPRPAAKAQRKPKKSVSWFIPADDLRAEARKENSPEEASRRSVSWFEPCRRSPSWREPLRLRQVHQLPHQLPPTSPKIGSSHLTPLSLQEALHLRRPDFVSRSRRRMLCLLQQEEERKLHGGFGRETEEFYRLSHGVGGWTHRPAGIAVVRRAVPRKEMIQRSKQIYDNLPEVQRRREEQRRQAEYHTYRLNARLYNKRITNRVLGRRTAWY